MSAGNRAAGFGAHLRGGKEGGGSAVGRASREEWGLVLGTWGPSRDLSRGRSAGSRTSASAALEGGEGADVPGCTVCLRG